MLRTIVRTAVAVGFAVFAARQAVFGVRDLARYNKMREMSDDPPLGMGHKKPETNAAARVRNPFVLLMSVPGDIERYVKMKSM